MATTASAIITALYGITFSATAHTKEKRVSVHDIDFEKFHSFPLIIIVDGPGDTEITNLITEISYYPSVHFFTEGESAANLLTWRDTITAAICGNTTLRALVNTLELSIAPDEAEDSKLQHYVFDISCTYDITHT